MASFIASLVFLSMLITTTVQACQFSSSCTGMSFRGNIMFANCSSTSGRLVRSSLDVNQCVGVDSAGALDCSSGFAAKCSNVTFSGITVAALCSGGRRHKLMSFSNRALDECIGSVQGKLTCC